MNCTRQSKLTNSLFNKVDIFYGEKVKENKLKSEMKKKKADLTKLKDDLHSEPDLVTCNKLATNCSCYFRNPIL